jgi:hypothetical protein
MGPNQPITPLGSMAAAIATYRPSYAPKQSHRATARPITPTRGTTAKPTRGTQTITESRAIDLIFERGKIAANLSGADLQTTREIGASLFFRWQDRQTMPAGLPDILQILATEIESRQSEIREYRRKLDARLEYEENHLA